MRPNHASDVGREVTAPATPDDLTLDQVAARLGKSRRWLQTRLADDGRRQLSQQVLQHHHYIGRSPRWTENEYLALRAAIIVEDTEKRRLASKSKSGTDTGISSVRFGSKDIQSALERVLNFRPGQSSGRKPTPSDDSANKRSMTRSSTASSRPSRSRLRLIDTSTASGSAR